MRPRARTILSLALVGALLALALAVPAAQAQPPAFSEPYQLRAGLLIPTARDPAALAPDAWNVEQRFTFESQDTGPRELRMAVPAGAAVRNASCTCGIAAAIEGSFAIWRLDDTLAPGSYEAVLVTAQPFDRRALATSLVIQPTPRPGVAIVFVPNTFELESPVPVRETLASTDGSATIVVLQDPGGGLPNEFWMSVHRATQQGTATTGEPGQPAARDAGDWLWIGAAFVLGAVLWALLVSRGVVQRRTRKQVAAVAPHVEAAKAEPKELLEARKRALMAALKEVELARQANEIDVPTYDLLKGELKRETVTVMRAIEEAGAKGDRDGPKA